MAVEWITKTVAPVEARQKAEAVVDGFPVAVGVGSGGYMDGRISGTVNGILVLAYLSMKQGSLEDAQRWAEEAVPVLVAHGWVPRRTLTL